MVARNPRIALIAALFCGVGVAAARGDVVHLKTGQKVEGKILSQAPDAISIRTKFGDMKIERSKIDRIESQLTPEEQLDAQVAAAGKDAAKLWEAAIFAREKKLTDRFKHIAKDVVALDPNHRGANEAIGNVEFEGKFYPPKEVEGAKSEFAAEMQAQGYELFEGEWVKKHVAMARRGFEEYEGEWLKPGEVYRRKAAILGPQLLGTQLPTTDSAHFSVRSALAPEQTAELVELLESGYEHFVKTMKLTETERKILDYFPIAVEVLPESEIVEKFVEPGGYMERMYNPPKDVFERYKTAKAFAIFFPRPLIVLTEGRHNVGTGSPLGGPSRSYGLLGFAANQLGNVLIRTFKRGGAVPGWLETGFAHYYEARLNHYHSLSIVGYEAEDEPEPDVELPPDPSGKPRIRRWESGLYSFNDWYAKVAQPEFRASLPPMGSLIDRPAPELAARDLVKAYFLVRWLMDTDPEKLSAYARAARQQDPKTKVVTTELGAFADVFGFATEELDKRFEAWAATVPPSPPPF